MICVNFCGLIDDTIKKMGAEAEIVCPKSVPNLDTVLSCPQLVSLTSFCQ